jgi:hypothetical protein
MDLAAPPTEGEMDFARSEALRFAVLTREAVRHPRPENRMTARLFARISVRFAIVSMGVPIQDARGYEIQCAPPQL